MAKPTTQYADSGDVAIAYQVTGDGPIDLVYAQGWLTNVEYAWESPHYAEFVSGTVKDLSVGSGLDFQPAGVFDLKGVPGDWPLFLAAS